MGPHLNSAIPGTPNPLSSLTLLLISTFKLCRADGGASSDVSLSEDHIEHARKEMPDTTLACGNQDLLICF